MDVVAEAREFVERQMRSRFAKVRAKTHRLQQPALKPVCCTVEEQKATETRPLLLTSKSKATKRPPVSAFSFKCRPSRAPRLDRDGFVLSSSFGSRSLPPGTAQCAAAETAAPRLESRNAWSPWSRRPSAAHVPRFSFGSVGSDGTEASLTYSSCHGSCVGSRVATWGNIGCTGVMEAEDETREESDAGQVCAVKTLTLSSILHKEPEVEVARRLSWDEQAKWRSSFNRFRHDGEIHKDDLINALEHCGFDDRRPDLVQETLVQVTSYAALDREEFLRFVCLYETRLHELYRSEFHRYASEGVMCVSGLPQLLQEFGLEPRRYVLQELLSETQSSEHLEFHDVAKIMELLRAREGFLVAELERFRRVFQDFDSDASGDMSVNELGSALCWLGFPHSHEKIEVLYQEGDIDRSGSLNESEFVVVLRRIQDGELGTIRSFLQSTENCEVSTLKELELLLGKLGYYQTSAAALMEPGTHRKASGPTRFYAQVHQTGFFQCEAVDGNCLATGGPQHTACTPNPIECDESMPIDTGLNLAAGVSPTVSSECYTNNPCGKQYLTDGDTRATGTGDRQYWHACSETNPYAEVALFAQACVREIKIWSRADCCSSQMQGAVAEVWSDGSWKQCGGTSTDVGIKKAFSFKCALVGTKARVIKKVAKDWITISELQVFPKSIAPSCDATMAIDTSRNLAAGVSPTVSSECYKNNPCGKQYLTDGNTRATGTGDRQYWHACKEANPYAEVVFAQACVREIKIWSRADCCSAQMQGAVAEVWSDGSWKQCGGTSTDVGIKKAFSFKCALVGTKARVIKHTARGWITISELQDAMQAAGIGTGEDKLSADMHLDLDDICTLLHYLRNREGFTDAQMEDLRLAFQKGKQEDAEKIPVSILHKALRWLGHCYTFDRAQQLIYEVDASAGAMDFTTFVKLVRKCRDFERRAAIGAFYAADPRHVGTLDEAGACLALSKIGLLEFQKGEEQQTDLEHFLLQVMRCQEERLHCLRKNCAFAPGQLEELRYHFKKSDKEGNGVLKRYDLARLVETLFPAQAHLCEFRPFL
ncbi:unnamed protein product, partial [Effrenium voratum]